MLARINVYSKPWFFVQQYVYSIGNIKVFFINNLHVTMRILVVIKKFNWSDRNVLLVLVPGGFYHKTHKARGPCGSGYDASA